MLIQKAVVDGDLEHGVMATGIVGGRIDDIPSCKELVERIIAEARARIGALAGSPAAGAPVAELA
jgi:NAD(P)H-dependent flavin oxidoreductase YrpB (nitropropane dioxygenase family)